MGVDFLGVKKNPGKGRGEIEGRVGGIVGRQDQRIGELRGGEVGREEGLVVNVGGVFFYCCHREGVDGLGVWRPGRGG